MEPDIETYFKELRDQIDGRVDNTDTYVILRLNDYNNVNNLTNILSSEKNLKYILKKLNTSSFYDEPVQINNIYTKIVNWNLLITGFKYGAKKNSSRQLGLLAYNTKNPPSSNKFKTKIFYDSGIKYSGHVNKMIQKIIKEMMNYLNNNNYNVSSNYLNNDNMKGPSKEGPRKKGPRNYDGETFKGQKIRYIGTIKSNPKKKLITLENGETVEAFRQNKSWLPRKYVNSVTGRLVNKPK